MSTGIFQPGSQSPLTTKGDLYTFGTGDAKLAVGPDGQVLTADSASLNGIKWAVVSATPAFTASSTAKTSGFTAVGNNLYLLDGSSATYAVTFDVASSYSGQIMSLLRTDNTPSKPINLVVNGSTTVHMHTFNESWLFYSEGANWRQLEHRTKTVFTAAVGISFLSTGTTAPVFGQSMTVNKIQWARDGRFMLGRFALTSTSATGAADGNGAMLMTIPSALVADTTDIAVNTTATTPDATSPGNLEGMAWASNGSNIAWFSPVLHSTTQMHFAGAGNSAGELVWGNGGTASFALNTSGANLKVSGWFRVPITLWEE